MSSTVCKNLPVPSAIAELVDALPTSEVQAAAEIEREEEERGEVIPRPGDQNPSQADPAFLRLEPPTRLSATGVGDTRYVRVW